MSLLRALGGICFGTLFVVTTAMVAMLIVALLGSASKRGLDAGLLLFAGSPLIAITLSFLALVMGLLAGIIPLLVVMVIERLLRIDMGSLFWVMAGILCAFYIIIPTSIDAQDVQINDISKIDSLLATLALSCGAVSGFYAHAFKREHVRFGFQHGNGTRESSFSYMMSAFILGASIAVVCIAAF